MSKKVFVIGHKNPDTDSICSAIAYANLKSKLFDEEYLPKRAGDISEETRFVLERFGVQEPGLMDYAGTQVRDIDIRRAEGLKSDISLKKAWNLMRDLTVATMPITEGSRLTGIISVKDIATANMDIYDNHILAEAKTSYKNILETLDGTLLIGDDAAVVTGGKVLIAAANPDKLEDYIEEDDIVILGNRYDSQICAIEMKAECIIVCLGSPVSKTILKLSEEKGCAVISTPHDSYMVARLINQSMPVSFFMRRDHLVTFEIDEYTEEVTNVMAKVRHRDFPVVDIYGNYIGMISRRSLLDTQKKKVILVDHNEKSQAVDGLEGAEILEIVDHHRLGGPETMSPIFVRNQPVGCTATIIYQMYNENQVAIEPGIAGLLCAAILSDTLMFRSPTCTPADVTAAETLAEIAKLDIPPFASELFLAGSNLKDKSPEEILHQDYKKFTVGGMELAVTQNTFMNAEELKIVSDRLSGYLEPGKNRGEVDMLFIMLTNILEESTTLLFYGEGAREVAECAMGKKAEDGKLLLEGVVSRKKQLIPALMAALRHYEHSTHGSKKGK
ncbi:Cobalt-dependent inorganic pyrophosphatase [bioreactor metagenome]|uniref:inorganic diphosphatase n=1 Tax=bioreactor metagenome TaxID=1076179 RepID=A0A644WY92_9ZZZZ